MSDFVFYPVTGDGLTATTPYVWNTGTINFNTGSFWASVPSFGTLTIGSPVTTGTVPGAGANVALIAGDISSFDFSFYSPNPSHGDPFIASHSFPVDVVLNSGSIDLNTLLLAGFNSFADVGGAQSPTLDVEGAKLTVSGAILDTGVVNFPPINIFGSTISSATASGGGTIDIGMGGSVDIGGAVPADIAFHFNDAAGNVLEIDSVSTVTPTAFLGTITGFVPGDTILLPGIPAVDMGVTTTDSYNVNTGVLSISVGDPTTINLNIPGLLTAPTIAFNGSGIELVTCFVAGTRIATPDGETPIEALRTGDLVLTAGGEHAAIKWIGERHIDLTCHPDAAKAQPIRIRRDAIAAGVPSRDLLVSPDHALLLDGVLIPARLLRNGASILRERDVSDVLYLHIELDRHDILLAEGLAAESYLDTGNRGLFENAGLPVLRHPDLTADEGQARRAATSCAPFADDAARVEPIWRDVAARAEELGYTLPVSPTTDDPVLRIMVDGTEMGPVSIEANRHVFVLPAGAQRLVSRAAAPCETRPWIDDRRLLGVAVRRITRRIGDEREVIPLDHPALSAGWWGVERDTTTAWRWTNGDATLPVAAKAAILEVELTGTVPYLRDCA